MENVQMGSQGKGSTLLNAHNSDLRFGVEVSLLQIHRHNQNPREEKQAKMQAKPKTLTHSSFPPLQNPNLKLSPPILWLRKPTFSIPSFHRSISLSCSPNFKTQNRSSNLKSYCISPSQELSFESNEALVGEKNEEETEEEETRVEIKGEGLANQSIWNQIKEIVKFTGPATGLWICGPLMSLIDTAVIGQGSSIELAALGPATVVCDYMGYLFMFLSIATSNLVATSLAKQDKNEVQHQISNLLFIGLICGFLMLFFTIFCGSWALTAFSGPKNAHLIPSGNTYIQIRGLAWPAVLVGWVAQSASLGMKDSWGPLKALAAATAINGIGDVVLCIFLGYGIAGAAWATMVSQVVAAYMMIEALNKKGYNAFAISIPSLNELLTVLALAAPVFVTLMLKVAFYSLLIYFATSMGTHTVAAHQVMLQTFSMCTVWGEPLSQTAQSFMPELIYGVNRNLAKARMLLKSLLTIGATFGLVLGIIGTGVPRFFPNIFTPDQKVIQEMHMVLLPYFLALAVTPSTHSLEGSLLAGRDLKFISLSMSGCFAFAALVLLLLSTRGYGLPGCWFALVGFQWARFSLALQRLLSPNGILYSEDLGRYESKKLRVA
ncbi:Multi antimicrobial extrusion protein [Corchorus capsularis]|uniref:Protein DETOXIFICATION n=1 Tax=Corchorus capsularis TaxID=210143 RepID=A0A1R3HVJ2_COCAP|nr:Multi antimicrobial extrusion protein [Corchorus capsularis]